MQNISDKQTAVVTGGSAGIGMVTCQHLLKKGYRVLSLSRRASEIEHDDLVNITVDLMDRDSTAEAASEISRYSPTVIVHNAGIVRSALLEEVSLQDLDDLVNLYLGSTITLTQACLPAMKKAQMGRVIMISSRAAVGLATRTAYSATKSGQIGLARTWALELGQYGITVNVIAPGPIATKMFTDVVPEGSEKEDTLIDSLPMRRIGTPDDIARAVMYFSDPLNNFVTGQTLFICGGASVGFLQI